jgi:Flp pilus assembly protein TadG
VSTHPKRQELDRHPERGAVLVIVAIVLPVIMIMGAIVIDLGHLFTVRTQLQATADAAALAAVGRLGSGTTQARAAAVEYAAHNYPGSPVVATTDIVLGRWSGGTFSPNVTPTNAVRVTARRSTANSNPVPLFLGGFVGKQFSDVSASAVAVFAPAGSGSPCVLSMAQGGKQGFRLEANARVDAPNCWFHTNNVSTTAAGSEEAVFVGAGTALLRTLRTTAVGDKFKIDPPTTRANPYPTPNSDYVEDPLASLPAPNTSGSCQFPTDGKIKTNGTLQPGVYCKGMEFASNVQVTLSPGTYIVKGPFTTSGGSNVVGHGVTIFLTCSNFPCGQATPTCRAGNAGETINIGSTSRVELTAPTSGPYRGIVFFQDRTMVPGEKFIEPSGTSPSPSVIDGVFYMRCAHPLTIQKSTGADWRVAVISHTFRVKGGAEFGMEQLPTNLPDQMGGGAERLRLAQ